MHAELVGNPAYAYPLGVQLAHLSKLSLAAFAFCPADRHLTR